MEAETCKRELLIEIPVDAVRKESDRVAAKYSRSVRVPGFRPGHVPTRLVHQRFREEIKSEVVQALLPKFFNDAVKDRQLSAVGQPEFEDLKFEEGHPLTCKATFEVLPEFELKEYKGLEVEEEPVTVTEAEVAKALEELRESAATVEVVADRPATDGDDVTVSYQGRDVQDAKAEPLEGREIVIHLDAEGRAGFEENLRGSKAGDTREFKVSYPEDFPSKRLAGKTIRYRVEVHGIKRKVLPGLDDELARTVSEFSTLEELRDRVRQDVERLHRRKAEKTVRQKLVDELLKRHQFPVPASMVQDQLEHSMEIAVAQLVSKGIDPRTAPLDWSKLREKMQPEAEQAVRAAIILQRIAEAERMEVSEEELDQSIREMAQQRGEAPAALKTRLTRDGGVAKLQSSWRSQKALDFVYRNAQITHPMSQDEQVRERAGQTS